MAPAFDVPSHGLAHFFRSHDLIGQSKQPSLGIFGPGSQGEHMAGDRVFLSLIQVEVPSGAPCGVGAMDKGVHMADPLPTGVTVHKATVPVALPIISEEIMEQGGSGQSSEAVFFEVEFPSQAVSAPGGIEGVDIEGIFPAVMGTGFQFFKQGMGDDIICHILERFCHRRFLLGDKL